MWDILMGLTAEGSQFQKRNAEYYK